jgi:hypothetical protein
MKRAAQISAAKAGLSYFGAVFAIGFALGILRVLIVIPRLGETAAVLIELPILLVLAWIICRSLVARFQVGTALDARLVMGTVAFVVLMIAEIAGSTLGFGRTLSEHFQQYRHIPGLLGLAGQVAFAIFPVVQSLVGLRTRT